MSSVNTETETVIKKILPYLFRRGYKIEDMDFETGVKTTTNYEKGYVDILITCGRSKPLFLIEAKRISKKLAVKDRDQAIAYAKPLGILFVVVTNGIEMRCYNVNTKQPITWDGKLIEKIPSRIQLDNIITILKSDKNVCDIKLSAETSLPYRHGLALRQLNGLFNRIHNTIRKIEKDEEHSFADFSKLLFLKLLEEKSDISSFSLPYSYRFHELAAKPTSEDDQVKDAILRMRDEIIKNTPYGDVLADQIHLRNAKTFKTIVKELSAVSFSDSGVDSKGAAFEYFVRATLKGKKLGQYFTPRNLVRLMAYLVGREKIVNQLLSGQCPKVLDPACGTGGFLVYLMQEGLSILSERLNERSINQATHDSLANKLRQDVFFGSDANPGVACAAKMNMIIAGDGHTNIRGEDSLSESAKNWSLDHKSCNLIFTNPPFGTSESESLTNSDLNLYPVRTSKGQYLFLQKMILSTITGGEICSVIDEGVLNTESAAELRKWILANCKLIAIVRLPDETFKPNKINVKCSLLYLERLEHPDLDGELDYSVSFIDLQSIGYEGSGDAIRGFDFPKLLSEVKNEWLDTKKGSEREGAYWSAFDIPVSYIRNDKNSRFDVKYWEPSVRDKIEALRVKGGKTVAELNLIPTERGKSPESDNYVDEKDGYALVIKAGSNISKFGELISYNSDWIEKNIYDEYVEKAKTENRNINLVLLRDVLVSSTGDGTLGKSCVYNKDSIFAVADGHVSILRIDKDIVHPEYLSDYLRCGFGAVQINRLFTGSTGLIELTPDDLNQVVVDLLSSIDEQKEVSKNLRKAEVTFINETEKLKDSLQIAIKSFSGELN